MKHTIYDSEDDAEGLYLTDEKENLCVDTEPSGILCIADLGLWNGRRPGYRMLEGRLDQVFKVIQGDFVKLYYDSEDDDLKMDDTHHDGTNHYLFREVREDRRIEELLDKVFDGTYTKSDLNRYTKPLGKYVRRIYGWKKAAKKAAKKEA